MKPFLALAICGALSVPALAVAQDQAAQPAPAAAEQPVKAEKPKKICKSEADAIASRLGTKKVCRTQAEWDVIEGRKSPKSNAG
jgi:invasion protein IalB